MKLPKTRRTYCPTCKKYTVHNLSEAKRKTPGSAHPMSYGSKLRAKLRGRMGKGNMGRYSKGALSGWKMYGKKTSKKTDIRLECSVCKKIRPQAEGFRARRIEFK
ncbi:MAG: hypothetical protein QW559_00380 [Candidatus Woesearchaeota archaeon]